ncbi:Rz lytic protein [Pantoea phytobeneficialis]|uniref:Rz lytic protein n=1 Tax=Pantoea phytobeneficialis TaxID=2052056 RepID=A0AAP9KNX6_9GAMM|nr:Rz lytic protein [Pantoea phytobeneficialis]MDO6406271.1 Rz lytic protein [Pantoea phytobeneficialis]QGR06237.1 Rz lytic protein [Pantoea phytobeneficialis]
MLNVISFIRNYSHIIIIGLVCVCLWGLNARNSQLSATNDRLEKLTDSKDSQINDLRSKNDDLASSVNDLVKAVNQQNAVMSEVAEQRAVTVEQNRKLQNEIKRYLAADKCAAAPVDSRAVERLRDAAKSASGGVPDNQPAPVKPASGTDKPD